MSTKTASSATPRSSVCYAAWWCIVDFEDDWVMLRIGRGDPSPPPSKYASHDDYIVGTDGFEESYHLWDKLNEIQFSPVPSNLAAIRKAVGRSK